MPPRFSLTLTDLTSSVNAPLVLYVKRILGYIDVRSNYVFLSAPQYMYHPIMCFLRVGLG
jgi:hypothetical protein